MLREGSDIREADKKRDGIALAHLQGFPEAISSSNVTLIRPMFAYRDRGPEWETLNRYFVVEFDGSDSEFGAQQFRKLPDVEASSADFLGHLGFMPNDPGLDVEPHFNPPASNYPYQWYLLDAPGIDAPKAWDFVKGDSSVVIGIVDTGIRYDHVELSLLDPPGPNDNQTVGNIWVNPGEIPGNAIDDDSNGYVDDVIGWDFEDGDNDPIDTSNSHGTFIAGEIAGLSNNSYGMSGLAGGGGDGSSLFKRVPGTKVIPCGVDFGGVDAVVALSKVSEAFVYLGDLRADGTNLVAVNCSFGFFGPPGLADFYGGAALSYLLSQDVLVVASAMNENEDDNWWPAERSDVLAVGATDTTATPTTFTNYGSWVNVAAPGEAIFSIGAQSITRFNFGFGTSYAAPLVVGIAALLKSYDPSLTKQQLWDLIVNNTTPYVPTKNVGSGIANAWLALSQILDEVVVGHTGTKSLILPLPQDVVFTAESYGGGTVQAQDTEVYYRTNGGSFTSVTCSGTGSPDEFRGTIPAQALGTTVDYYIRAENTEGQVQLHPKDAPASFHTYRLDSAFVDDMETPSGWYVASTDEGNGGPGWEWADPVGSAIQPEDDHSATGTHCWVTGALAGGTSEPAYDVDGGAAVLYSPCFDLAGATDVVASYWFYLHAEERFTAYPGNEPFWRVEVTNDSGSSWTVLEDTDSSSAGWEFREVDLDSLFGWTDQIQFRFTASDPQRTSWIEGLVDDFQLVGVFETATSVVEGVDLRIETTLGKNAPNPFNPITSIRFSLSKSGPASIMVYDIAGRLVRVLADREFSDGEHRVSWDGLNESGAPVTSGTYFYRLEAADQVLSKKMALLR